MNAPGFITKQDGTWLARDPDTGIVATGSTLAEALRIAASPTPEGRGMSTVDLLHNGEARGAGLSPADPSRALSATAGPYPTGDGKILADQAVAGSPWPEAV